MDGQTDGIAVASTALAEQCAVKSNDMVCAALPCPAFEVMILWYGMVYGLEKTAVSLLAVILSLTRGAANILKAVIRSTTQVRTVKSMGTVRSLYFLCDNEVVNCRAATWLSLLVGALH